MWYGTNVGYKKCTYKYFKEIISTNDELIRAY